MKPLEMYRHVHTQYPTILLNWTFVYKYNTLHFNYIYTYFVPISIP